MNALVRVIPVAMTRGRALAQKIFATTPTAVSAAGKKLGMLGAPASKILGAMKDNKLMTALVLMELGTEGSELLSEMAAHDKEIADLVSRYGVSNDPVSENAMADITAQADEMKCITVAANTLGGLSKLHNLRRALSLSEESYKYYDALREMQSSLRA